MALQKWAAPAYARQVARTETGPAGLGLPESVSFGSLADIAVGATMRMFMAGTVTTTGAPTVRLLTAAFDGDATPITDTAPSGVSAQPWTVEATFIVREITTTAVTYGYHIKAIGLFGTDYEDVGAVTNGTPDAAVSLGVAWDATADDADSGDILVTHIADALWIG